MYADSFAENQYQSSVITACFCSKSYLCLSVFDLALIHTNAFPLYQGSFVNNFQCETLSQSFFENLVDPLFMLIDTIITFRHVSEVRFSFTENVQIHSQQTVFVH